MDGTANPRRTTTLPMSIQQKRSRKNTAEHTAVYINSVKPHLNWFELLLRTPSYLGGDRRGATSRC